MLVLPLFQLFLEVLFAQYPIELHVGIFPLPSYPSRLVLRLRLKVICWGYENHSSWRFLWDRKWQELYKNHGVLHKGIMFENDFLQCGKVFFQVTGMLFNEVYLQVFNKVVDNEFIRCYQKIENVLKFIVGQVYRTAINTSFLYFK